MGYFSLITRNFGEYINTPTIHTDDDVKIRVLKMGIEYCKVSCGRVAKGVFFIFISHQAGHKHGNID